MLLIYQHIQCALMLQKRNVQCKMSCAHFNHGLRYQLVLREALLSKIKSQQKELSVQDVHSLEPA